MLKIKDDEFKYLVNMVKTKYGINLTQKRTLLEGRLANYLAERGFSDYSAYIKALESDKTGQEITNFLNKVTTNHTYFMREVDHFDIFRDRVLPFWEQRISTHDLRTWCAASSSGEEPYTLAMILHDYFAGKLPRWDTTLLATDISLKALEQAKLGEYTLESIEKIPKVWKSKYFVKAGPGTMRVSDQIKKEVVFARFNLMDEIAAKRPYHIIFCRNVMIYFDGPTKAALVDRFYDVMAPGGFLFIGQAESLAKPSRFVPIMPSVYQKGDRA